MSEVQQQKPSTEQTIQSQAKRQDPVNRPTNGTNDVRIVGSDPNRRYVFAYLGDGDFGSAFYEELGYVVEKCTERGVRIANTKTRPGDMLLYRGHVLMSIDKKEYENIYQNGGMGAGLGQVYHDALKKKIVGKQEESELLRGVGGRDFMHVQNLTDK